MNDSVRIIMNKISLADTFDQNKDEICLNDTPFVSGKRLEAIKLFIGAGFPTRKLEEWKSTDLANSLIPDYQLRLKPPDAPVDIDKIFRCEIHNFETFLFTHLNGWYVYRNSKLTVMPNGVVVGSIAEAMRQYPDLFETHYGKYADDSRYGLVALNTAFAQDGMFIWVPDGVQVEKPIQMVNVVSTDENIFIQSRNLIILGKNSNLTLVHCDDSIQHKSSFINAVTEVYLGENAAIDHYKLQNKDDLSTVINSTFFYQEENSLVTTNTMTLNGGVMRNDTHLALAGAGAEVHAYGLYLLDRKQHVDNQVFVDHISPGCKSYELYKGIIDDDGSAVFNGHINVQRDAQKTEAYQSNRNILLSDTAQVNTKPFLEIYADDVKCSHGATVGQLDPEAMFYLRSRGICERNAKMLLMYAFAGEVVNKISIDVLRNRIDNMIVKRLKGELSICDMCVLHCKDNNVLNFEIDLSRV